MYCVKVNLTGDRQQLYFLLFRIAILKKCPDFFLRVPFFNRLIFFFFPIESYRIEQNNVDPPGVT